MRKDKQKTDIQDPATENTPRTHGGRRDGAGRKLLGRKRKCVYLPPSLIELVRDLAIAEGISQTEFIELALAARAKIVAKRLNG